MKRLKKHAIGYNTVSSVDGVISARGVKSYLNKLEIFGKATNVGQAKFFSFSAKDFVKGTISVQDGSFRSGADYPNRIRSDNIFSFNFDIIVVCDDGYKYNVSYYDEANTWIKCENTETIFSGTTIIPENTKFRLILGTSTNSIVNTSIATHIHILTKYSIKLHINDSIIQVPTPCDLSENDALLKLNDKYVIYQHSDKTYIELPERSQNLLNSFTLQNQNRIFVEGTPNIKVSGYLQKEVIE